MGVGIPQKFKAKPVEPPRPRKNPDTIKLFVGQVPKTFEERDLLPYLEQFGPIYDLSVLRDKLSHAHKGLLGTVVMIMFSRQMLCLSIIVKQVMVFFCRVCICDVLQ